MKNHAIEKNTLIPINRLYSKGYNNAPILKNEYITGPVLATFLPSIRTIVIIVQKLALIKHAIFIVCIISSAYVTRKRKRSSTEAVLMFFESPHCNGGRPGQRVV
jgi:hypothetical protein